MKITKEVEILNILNNVRFATVYNLEPWFYKRAESLEGRLQTPYRILLRLKAKGLIKEVKPYPEYDERLRKWERFFTPIDNNPVIAYRELCHDSQVTDVLVAFIFLYPDYDIIIKRKPTYKIGKKLYRPDASITLNGKEKSYHYIIEVERSREPKELIEKLDNIVSYGHPSKWGLPNKTKILVICSKQDYGGYWRPSEYLEVKVERQIELVSNRLNSILKKARHLPLGGFCFMPIFDFYQLNKPVWYTPQGIRTQLIN